MADVKWIKITTDVFDDEKILLIETLPDAYAIITVWFKLLCLAGKQNNSGVFLMGRMPYTDKMLATIFRMKEATVTMALQTFEQFGMIEIIDGVITIPNWNKHQSLDAYEKKKERDRLYQAERRAAQRALISGESEKSSDTSFDSQPTQSSYVAFSEEDKEKRKKKEEKKRMEIFKEGIEQIPALYKSICISLPSIKSLNDSRITELKARLTKYTVDDFKTLFEKAEASSFLKGNNDRKWTATFDWLIAEDNMLKVLEGNFDNSPGKTEPIPKWMQYPKSELAEKYDALQKQKATAADDENIRVRAEALKQQFANQQDGDCI